MTRQDIRYYKAPLIEGHETRFKGHRLTGAKKQVFSRGITKCFFTGLEFDLLSKNGSRSPTIEHLIPKYLCHSIEYNNVICCRAINNMIGNAPLVVKFALKDHLANFQLSETSDKAPIRQYEDETELFFRRYKSGKIYCWNFHSLNDIKKRREALKMYIMLMTTEEFRLFYKKHKSEMDILDYLA